MSVNKFLISKPNLKILLYHKNEDTFKVIYNLKTLPTPNDNINEDIFKIGYYSKTGPSDYSHVPIQILKI